MYFKRKAYSRLLDWKKNYADSYAVLLEGARRVGKSTIAEQFASREYKSYILIDFSIPTEEELACFEDIGEEIAKVYYELKAMNKYTGQGF